MSDLIKNLSTLTTGPQGSKPPLSPEVLAELADPNCPQARLAYFAHHAPDVVAQNPNTPIDTLEHLIKTARLWSVVQLALDNPALALYSMENPGAHQYLVLRGRQNIARKRLSLAGKRLQGDQPRRLGVVFARRCAHLLGSSPYVGRAFYAIEEWLSFPRAQRGNTLGLNCAHSDLGLIRIPHVPALSVDAPDPLLGERERLRRRYDAAQKTRQCIRQVLLTEVGWKELRHCAEDAREALTKATVPRHDPVEEAKAELNEWEWQVQVAEHYAATGQLPTGEVPPREEKVEQLSLLLNRASKPKPEKKNSSRSRK